MATYLNAQEMADKLGISKQSVWRLARLGKIPCIKIGRQYRFCEEDIRKGATNETGN